MCPASHWLAVVVDHSIHHHCYLEAMFPSEASTLHRCEDKIPTGQNPNGQNPNHWFILIYTCMHGSVPWFMYTYILSPCRAA